MDGAGWFGIIFGQLDAPLDFANRSQVFVDFSAVGCAELAGKAPRFAQNIIEYARFIPQPLMTVHRILVEGAEQAFENRARIHFGR